MVEIAKRHTDQLTRIKDNIQNSYDSFSGNNTRYEESRTFLFKSSLSNDEIQNLKTINKPQLEFMVLEAYVSRLIGEFSKQTPSFKSRALNPSADPLTVSSVEAHLRHILAEADNNHMQDEVYKEALTGGFSAIRMWTEYENEDSFNQVLKLGKVFDPTLCGFDPLARMSHKGDGEYCYHLYPRTREEFEKEWPSAKLDRKSWVGAVSTGLPWFIYRGNQQALLLVEYFEKEKHYYRRHRLADGRTMSDKEYKNLQESWNSIEQLPEIVESRKSSKTKIIRYTLIGDQVLERKETSFSYLPLFFIDGNSAILHDGGKGASYQFTRPYFYHAVDAQRLKNFCGQTFANEMENMPTQKFMLAVETVDDELSPAWKDPQQRTTLPYRSRSEDGQPLPPPSTVPRLPIDKMIYESFLGTESTIQNILGSYDAALGINNNQLSGLAIVEGATQSNAAAMPYVTNYMAAMNQIALSLVDMLPKLYITPRTVPVVRLDGSREFISINPKERSQEEEYISFMYPHNSLEVTVEAGVNFQVQQRRSLVTMMEMAKAFPAFAEFINDKGLEVLLSNLDIRNGDVLVTLAKEYEEAKKQAQKAQAQHGEQPTPEEQKIAFEDKKMHLDMIKSERQIQSKEEDRKLDLIKEILRSESAESKNKTDNRKVDAKLLIDTQEIALEQVDQGHRHIREAVKDAVDML